MIITKLQQFIIFNCDQSQITIPSSLSAHVSKITKINPPTGSSLVTWSDGVPVQQLNLLDPNTIYLVTSKEGQLGYEFPGAVDASGYCNNITGVYFEVSDGFSNNFVIRLINQNKINQARSQIAGVVPKLGITGIIIKNSIWYNPNYSFYYDSNTIDFFEVSMEVCDATFSYTEEYLSEAGGAFLPGLRLCPWGSYLTREIHPN